MARRILYLDLLRGFFIFYVIIIHGIAQIVIHADAEIMTELPHWFLIVITPFIILASWAPMFALVSGTANGYTMMVTILKQPPPTGNLNSTALWQIMKGPVINSLLLYGLSVLNIYFFHYGISIGGNIHYSTLTGSIELGRWAWGDPYMFFFSDAIGLMAISNLVICGWVALLWRKQGYQHTKRNVIILTCIGFVWFFSAPFLHAWLDPLFFSSMQNNAYGTAYVLKLIIGPTESTFPNAAYAIFGACIGFALATNAPLKRIQQYGYGFGVMFLIVAICWMLITKTKFILGPENIGKALPFNVHLIHLVP